VSIGEKVPCPMSTLVSPNKKYTATINEDKRVFGIYNVDGSVRKEYELWNNAATAVKPFYLAVQDDGNIVVYANNKAAVWATYSNSAATGAKPYKLRMQDNGDLVFYDNNNKVFWSSNTGDDIMNLTDSCMSSNEKVPCSLTQLVSQNKKFVAKINDDKNVFGIYNSDGSVRKEYAFNQSASTSKKPFYLSVQNDGNIVVYSPDGSFLWASYSNRAATSNRPYKLKMQDDGNLVLYDNINKPLWSSGTAM
jgi:hypothetical protein